MRRSPQVRDILRMDDSNTIGYKITEGFDIQVETTEDSSVTDDVSIIKDCMITPE